MAAETTGSDRDSKSMGLDRTAPSWPRGRLRGKANEAARLAGTPRPVRPTVHLSRNKPPAGGRDCCPGPSRDAAPAQLPASWVGLSSPRPWSPRTSGMRHQEKNRTCYKIANNPSPRRSPVLFRGHIITIVRGKDGNMSTC